MQLRLLSANEIRTLTQRTSTRLYKSIKELEDLHFAIVCAAPIFANERFYFCFFVVDLYVVQCSCIK